MALGPGWRHSKEDLFLKKEEIKEELNLAFNACNKIYTKRSQ